MSFLDRLTDLHILAVQSVKNLPATQEAWV